MYLQIAAFSIFVILLVAFWFHVQKNRHPETKPVPSYLVFTTIFSTATVLIFLGLSFLATVTGLMGFVNTMIGGVIFLAITFALAFLVANSQLGKPPVKDIHID